MEEQYLRISKEQSKKLNKMGLRTFAETSISDGQKKIIGYLVNLSDVLKYLENESHLIQKIKLQHDKLKTLNSKINKLKEKIEDKEKELENMDLDKKINELIDKKMTETLGRTL
jgi:hypothetical protein